jgi:hypothetical protein
MTGAETVLIEIFVNVLQARFWVVFQLGQQGQFYLFFASLTTAKKEICGNISDYKWYFSYFCFHVILCPLIYYKIPAIFIAVAKIKKNLLSLPCCCFSDIKIYCLRTGINIRIMMINKAMPQNRLCKTF